MRRRLDTELVRRGLAPSRTRAAELVREGRITVAGAPALTPARQVGADEAVAVQGPPRRFVSRGGDKLDGVLDRFGVDVAGRDALDVGASTGGFTDCLLQRGARRVVAVDVGTNQLAWSLRNDPRVVVLEQTDIREYETIEPPPTVVTVDVAFVSVLKIAPALVRAATREADLVLLVKPQFEAGRARVGRGGVVRDAAVHGAVLREVRDGLAELGVQAVAIAPSPLRGADGNAEFFLHGRLDAPDSARCADTELDAVVAAVHPAAVSTSGNAPDPAPERDDEHEHEHEVDA